MDDKQKQAKVLQEDEERKRKQEIAVKIKSAQKFNQILALPDDQLSREEKQALTNAKTFEDFVTILRDKQIGRQAELFLALADWRDGYGSMPEPTNPDPSPDGSSNQTDAGASGGSLAGAGISALLRKGTPTYEQHLKDAEKYAEEFANKYDPKKFPNKQAAYAAARRTKADEWALAYGGNLAKEWAQEHGDSYLASALDRKTIQEKDTAYEEFKSISTRYAERAARDFDKKPTPGMTRDQAYDLAERDIHDTLASSPISKKRAKQWAEQHHDAKLSASVLGNWPTKTYLSQATPQQLPKPAVPVSKKMPPTYADLKEKAKTEALEAANAWSNTKDFNKTGTRQLTYSSARERVHDEFLKNNPELATEWAERFKDRDLSASISRAQEKDQNPPPPQQDTSSQRETEDDQVEEINEIIPESLKESATTTTIEQKPAPQMSQPLTRNYARRRGGLLNRANRVAARAKKSKRPSLKKKVISSVEKKIIIALIPVIIGFLLFIIVLISLCKSPLGQIAGFLGILPCSESTQTVTVNPGPGPAPDEKPTTITFQGGEAYLATVLADSSECRANCPIVNKGDTVTINIHVNFIKDQFNRNISNVKAVIPIDTQFFSNIQTTGNPEIGSILPTLNNFRIYTWSFKKPIQDQYVYTIKGKVESDNGDTKVSLTMSGVTIIASDTGDTSAGADARPSDKTCNVYGGIMDKIKKDFPLSLVAQAGANYGDPQCTYRADKFRKVIEATEPNHDNWDFWNDISDCESGSVNGYTPNAVGGSWGKFQMRRSFPQPFKKWTSPDDRGDVTWQKQIQNAVSYNQSLKKEHDNFGYWGTAMCLCYYDKYKSDSYCQDIIKNHDVRTPNSGKCSICTANKGKN